MRKIKMLAATVFILIILMVVEIYIIRSASSYEPVTEVVTAKVQIPEDTIITTEMLEVKKIAESLLHKDSVKVPEEIAGKKAGMDIESGEMLLTSKVRAVEDYEKIEVAGKDKRLFSVEFKGDQANGWWLFTGQYVDIIFAPEKSSINDPGKEAVNSGNEMGAGTGYETGEEEWLEQTIAEYGLKKLEHIRIVALIDEKGRLLKNSDRSTLPRYISFEVTDEQAEFLAAVKSRGRLELSVIPEE